MELFIRVDENGNAVQHPIVGDNFREAFPHIDVNNLPPEFARFVRVSQPKLGMYEVLESETPTYQMVDGVFTDVWSVREMTAEEKLAKQQMVQDDFRNRRQAENWAAWTFDEASLSFLPPVPKPEVDQAKKEQGIGTYWCGAENCWKDTPPLPDDGTSYIFDFFAWEWVKP